MELHLVGPLEAHCGIIEQNKTWNIRTARTVRSGVCLFGESPERKTIKIVILVKAKKD